MGNSDLFDGPLTEKYRPGSWEEVICQDAIVSRLRSRVRKRRIGGNAYWFSGPSGSGKTTLARLTAREVAGPLATQENNAADVDTNFIDRMEQAFGTTVLQPPHGRAWILNEAHLLRPRIASRLLTTLEPIPPYCVVIFTTTDEGQELLFENCQDASPLLSRCLKMPLNQRPGAEKIAARLAWIMEQEGMEPMPMHQLVKLVQSARNNIRAAIQQIDAESLCAA
jgi:DNA polymerase-3 subunit gamma/tau